MAATLLMSLANRLTADGGTFDSDVYRQEVIAFATKKQLVPAMHQIFIRAIGCNWLVCLACFLGTQAKDLGSKVIGMWLPIFAFVALGFDHVVANMFFIPLGIWLGTPDLTVGLYIWKGWLFHNPSQRMPLIIHKVWFLHYSATFSEAACFVVCTTGGCT